MTNAEVLDYLKTAATRERDRAPTPYEAAIIERCTADHPDHQYLFELRGEPYLWTVWCSICERKGYNDGDRHNRINIDMSLAYVTAVREAACLVATEEARISAIRKAGRTRRG